VWNELQYPATQVKTAVNVLQNFLERCNNIEDNVFSALITVENATDQGCINSLTIKLQIFLIIMSNNLV